MCKWCVCVITGDHDVCLGYSDLHVTTVLWLRNAATIPMLTRLIALDAFYQSRQKCPSVMQNNILLLRAT